MLEELEVKKFSLITWKENADKVNFLWEKSNNSPVNTDDDLPLLQ